VHPGDNRVTIYYAATNGALLKSVTTDGRRVFFGSAFERGHPMFKIDVELPARVPRTVVLHLSEPRTPGALTVPRQPLVRPMTVTIASSPCPSIGAGGR
jgi:hypothetical protein